MPLRDAHAPADRSVELSVVIPAFRQEAEIVENILEIDRRVADLGVSYELIVVDDGSPDATYDRAKTLQGPFVSVVGYRENRGKGNALRVGSGLARGRYVGWLDSDLDLDPTMIGELLLRMKETGADIIVGSKRHPASVVNYPLKRRVYSWLFQQLVRLTFQLNVRDTQVGMKLVSRPVIDEVLPVVLVKRFAFDLEVLAVSHALGFDRIEEAPVRLDYQFSGTAVNWKAVRRALWDTAAVFYRLRLRRYYQHRVRRASGAQRASG